MAKQGNLKHNMSFYNDKYNEYKRRVAAKGLVNEFRTATQFASYWDITVNDIKEGNISRHGSYLDTIVRQQEFPTEYRTAKAFRDAIKSESGINYNIKDLQKIEWEDLMSRHGNDIAKYNKKLKEQGINDSTERSRMISIYFFGSP